MKKIFAIVLAVILLATTGGVAMAAKFDPTGNGAISGPHYNLNIIGVEDPKTADMRDTNGHTIFVPLKGRAKINLINSTGTANDEFCGTKDFRVWDRNATDGPAAFCLPEPVVTQPGDCPGGQSEVHYTVFARALGGPNGKSFTTTCAEDKITDDVWCSSITMLLERQNGQSRFSDVSKYLLFIYADIGQGFKRYPIFDPALEGYFWDYVNDNLRLAQLRFYLTPTCVPDTVDRIVSGPDCIEDDGATQVTFTGSGTHFDTNLKIYIVDANGMDNIAHTVVPTPTDTSLTLNLTPSGGTVSPATIFITSGNGQDKETVRWDFEVKDGCV